MKVEVIYESVPYEIIDAMVIHHHRERTLCRRVVEVENLGDVYKVMEEKGFSNFIVSRRILNDDGTVNEEANKAEISGIISEIMNERGLSELLSKIKKEQSKSNIEKLNLTIKSWS